jgi:hypothetical protein
VTFENLVKEDFTSIKDVYIRERIYYQPVAKNYQSIDNSYIYPNQLQTWSQARKIKGWV